MREPETDAPKESDHGFALCQADIDEFKGIVRREFGVELSDHDAWARVIELLHLVRSLLGPIPEDPERFLVLRTSSLLLPEIGEKSVALE